MTVFALSLSSAMCCYCVPVSNSTLALRHCVPPPGAIHGLPDLQPGPGGPAEAHWSALTPLAPLRRWRLIEVSAGEPLTVSPLRIDERVLHYLTGVSYLDDRLCPLLELLRITEALPPSHHTLVQRITDLWSGGEHPETWPAVLLCGGEYAGKRALPPPPVPPWGCKCMPCVWPTSRIPHPSARPWPRCGNVKRS